MNNETEIESADGSKQKTTYDQKGNIIKQQDADGRNITYKYDALNQQVFKGFDDKEYVYEYNVDQKMTTVSGKKTKITMDYNKVGDMISYTDEMGNTVQYEYDIFGKRTALIYPTGRKVTYEYDVNDNLIKVTDGKDITTYYYDALNQLEKTILPNGTTTVTTYDMNGNLLSLETKLKDGELQSSHLYTYDELNNIKTETATIENKVTEKTYEYDAEEQLIHSSIVIKMKTKSDAKEQAATTDPSSQLKEYNYTYDVFGNKIAAVETVDGKVKKKQFSFDAANKLMEESSDNTIKYSYDKSGNVIRKVYATGVIEDFKYNATGQIIQIQNNRGKVINYTYDGLDNRISKEEKTTLTDENRDSLIPVLKGEAFNENYDSDLVVQETKEKLDSLKQTISEYTESYDQTCPDAAYNPQTKESQKIHYYVNDINAEYTEVLQVQTNNYEPAYDYTYGVQRISANRATSEKTYYQYDGRGSVIGQQNQKNDQLYFKIEYNDFGQTQRKTDTKAKLSQHFPK